MTDAEREMLRHLVHADDAYSSTGPEEDALLDYLSEQGWVIWYDGSWITDDGVAALQITRVINLKDTAAVTAAQKDGAFLRIDRTTRWGNPFRMTTEADRATVIEQYRAWIMTEAALLDALPTLRGKTLACWCAPRLCHGDVLVALLEGGDTDA